MTRLFGITVAGGLSSENQVFARLLAERGDRYEALVVVHDEGGAEAGVADHFAGLAKSPTVPLDTGWRPNPWAYRGNPGRAPVAWRYRRRLDRIIAAADQFEPGAVYSSQQHYDCRAASKVARSLGVPQIVHLHYTVGPWLRRVVLEQLRTTDRVVAVSDFVRQQAISHGVPEHRVTTIHNTTPTYVRPDAGKTEALRRELGLAHDQFVFGLVGRFDPGKGHLDAVAAFERVARKRDDVSLVLVGSGRIERKIRARARHSPAADRIITTGQRSDVPELLSVFDALVHPATQDPCPLAVLEAMAAALPVVAYADGGLPELVESGATGVLVGHGKVGALAEAMLALHDNPRTGRELGGAAARRIASDFAPTDAGARFADLITSMS
jgi:glycosyltransferase involved in cell wall biosynthesis